MPTPFSEELRQSIVLAIDSGMSVTEAADKFQVARRTIYYYLQRARSQMKTPRAAGRVQGHNPIYRIIERQLSLRELPIQTSRCGNSANY